VGKSNWPTLRFNDHCALDGSNKHKDGWIRSVLRRGRMPELRILEKCDCSEWQERERFWIAYYRAKTHGRLTNILDGGDGGPDLPPTPQQLADLKAAKMVYSGHDGLRSKVEQAGRTVLMPRWHVARPGWPHRTEEM